MPTKLKVYVETTIPSYITSRLSRDVIVLAHQQITSQWWENDKNKNEYYISPVVLEEIEKGDLLLAKERLNFVKDFTKLEMNDEIEFLGGKYFKELSLPQKAIPDAFHLAFCVSHKMDILLTWNCTHLANESKRRLIQKINIKLRKETPLICTPEELIGE